MVVLINPQIATSQELSQSTGVLKSHACNLYIPWPYAWDDFTQILSCVAEQTRDRARASTLHVARDVILIAQCSINNCCY